jgi:hypothetical protein
MLLFLAALAPWPPHVSWWNDFQREYRRCGLVFYVEGTPAGDGVSIEKDFSGLILSNSPKRKRHPIECIGAWAKKRGLKVRYKNF